MELVLEPETMMAGVAIAVARTQRRSLKVIKSGHGVLLNRAAA